MCCFAQAMCEIPSSLKTPRGVPKAHFWPSTGVRSITSTHASGALQIGRFQQSWVEQYKVKQPILGPA